MVFQYHSRVFLVSMFAALASLLQLLEVFIVLPIPFLKIGLANSIVIFFIAHKEYKAAFTISIIRLLIGNFFSGKLFSLPVIFSFSGGLISVIVMILLVVLFRKNISITAVSVVGAVAHNLTQLFLFTSLFGSGFEFSRLVSLLLLFSVLSGVLVAFVTEKLLKLNIEIRVKKRGYLSKNINL